MSAARRSLLISSFTLLIGACAPSPATNFGCADGGCEQVCLSKGTSCSDTDTCCPGTSCFMGACACGQLMDVCGGDGGQICCGDLECDPSGHCDNKCTQARGACQPFGGTCSSGADCCAPGTCNSGTCSDPAEAPTCGIEGAACATTSDCCGSANIPGSKLDCVLGTDGGNICHLGNTGEHCDSTHHCEPWLNCIVPVAPPMPDAGMDDGGMDDGGSMGDAGVVDAGVTGTCGPPKTRAVCNLNSATCNVGDSCDPNSTVDQGYDPCFFLVDNTNSLNYRTTTLVCNFGYCTKPFLSDGCDDTCVQAPGDPRPTSCLDFYNGGKLCMPECQTDSDCHGTEKYDSSSNNPQSVTHYCVNYGTKSGCQAELCYIDGDSVDGGLTKLGMPSNLYQPCSSHADSVCLPRFEADLSIIVGFCTAVRPDAGSSTVGQACDSRAGIEAPNSLCGPDATCLGGVCAKLCDAAELGSLGTPACDASRTCVSPQGLDLIADYQFGGCTESCDPFSDLEHSGCANFCGGPPTRCNWIISDNPPSALRGYCGGALKTPIPTGQHCLSGAVQPCEAGDYCLLSSDGVTRTCTKLCDPSQDAGPDTCPGTKKCTAFTGFKHSGYCP
jgi:hypothetical protein